jgi:hypothetical protein
LLRNRRVRAELGAADCAGYNAAFDFLSERPDVTSFASCELPAALDAFEPAQTWQRGPRRSRANILDIVANDPDQDPFKLLGFEPRDLTPEESAVMQGRPLEATMKLNGGSTVDI